MVEETPVAAAPVAAPAGTIVAPLAPTSAPALLSEPPAAAAPVVEAAPAAPPATPEPAPVAATPEAPAAAPAAEAAPPADATNLEAPKPEAAAAPEAPAVVDYGATLKVPEYLTVAPDKMGEFSGLLNELKATPEQAQKLMDFGGGFIKSTQQAMDQRQRDVFAETRAGWVKDAQKQFGNRFDTTVNDGKAAIAMAFPKAKERAAFWNVLAFTGAGDHPAVVDAFARLNRLLTERGAPQKGLPETGAKTGSPADRRYGRQQPTS